MKILASNKNEWFQSLCEEDMKRKGETYEIVAIEKLLSLKDTKNTVVFYSNYGLDKKTTIAINYLKKKGIEIEIRYLESPLMAVNTLIDAAPEWFAGAEMTNAELNMMFDFFKSFGKDYHTEKTKRDCNMQVDNLHTFDDEPCECEEYEVIGDSFGNEMFAVNDDFLRYWERYSNTKNAKFAEALFFNLVWTKRFETSARAFNELVIEVEELHDTNIRWALPRFYQYFLMKR